MAEPILYLFLLALLKVDRLKFQFDCATQQEIWNGRNAVGGLKRETTLIVLIGPHVKSIRGQINVDSSGCDDLVFAHGILLHRMDAKGRRKDGTQMFRTSRFSHAPHIPV